MDVSSTNEAVQQDSEYIRWIADKTKDTVTSLYASNQSTIQSPEDAVKILLRKQGHHLGSKEKHEILEHVVTQEEMNAVAKYGRFSQRPSDLFLKVCVLSIILKIIHIIFSYYTAYFVLSNMIH